MPNSARIVLIQLVCVCVQPERGTGSFRHCIHLLDAKAVLLCVSMQLKIKADFHLNDRN